MKALVLCLGLVAAGCRGSSRCGPEAGMVQTVVDGDTLELETGVRVRLLLVDAPEITGSKDDCYGRQAASYTAGLVAGQAVELSYDEASCTDRYGRTLAYVAVGGLELNTALVHEGYACALFIAPGGEARAEEFATYEAEARTARQGMWGQCSAIPCDE